MSDIVACRLKDGTGKVIALQLTIPFDRYNEFQTILNRALNTWDTAPAEWKELSDVLNHGNTLQNYYVHDTLMNKKNKHGV